jgi:GNAT superfamily N-acetyltransferase
MPKIQSYLKFEVPRDIAMQIVSGVRFTWPGFLDGKTPAWESTPYPAGGRHFVMMDGDMLVAHVLVSSRTLTHAGEAFVVYGLSSVFCFPGYRGKGFGEQTAEAATRHIREQADADLALLFCGERASHLYRRLGWEIAPGVEIRFGDNQLYSDGLTLALYVSDRARAHRFDSEPFHVGPKTW